MQVVHTDLGLGRVVESKTTRGRTEYRVAGQDFDVWLPETKLGFAPVDESNSVDLPYNPEPQYGVGPLTDGTIQPIHEIDPDKRTSPADSLSFEPRADDEGDERGEPGPNPDLFAKSSAIGDPTPHQTGPYGLGPNDPELREYAHPDFQDDYYDDPRGELNDARAQAADAHEHYRTETGTPFGDYMDRTRYQGARTADVLEGAPVRFSPEFIVNDTDDEFLRNVDVEEDERETTDPDGIVHFSSTYHEAFPAALAVPLARGVAQGLAGGAVQNVMNDQQKPTSDDSGVPVGQFAQEEIDKAGEGAPLPLPGLNTGGWGDLPQLKGSRRPAGLDERYADINYADYHRDPIAQFRHDPDAFINRVGHAESEGLNPRIAEYGALVEADEQIRTAAWKDVRAKAMRLRREGRVHVRDVGDDRIYASVEGDHGTYDVMIKKGGSFGGFGGGHAITNWHCACEWGKWAFQRRLTYVGRLCSHGYASYMEMQSNHMKGKQTAPQTKYRKRRSARDWDVTRMTEDEHQEGRELWERNNAENPDTDKDRLKKYYRTSSDQSPQDWKIDDTGKAKGALEELRDWAETPQEEDFGHMEDRVEDIRDAVDKAREEGVDADQLVASLRRQAAPEDEQPSSLSDMMGVQPSSTPLQQNPFAGGGFNPTQLPGVQGGPNTSQTAPLPNVSGTADTSGNVTVGTPDPTGGLLSAPYGGESGGSATPNNLTQPGGGGGGDADQPSGSGINSSGGGIGDASNAQDYTVKPGDTLSGIAESHGGGDYNDITNVGGGDIANKDLITPGQQLDLSALDSGGSSSSGGLGSSATPGGAMTDSTGSSGGSSSSDSKGWFGKGSARRTADHPGHGPLDPNANPAAPPLPGNPADPNAAIGSGNDGGGLAQRGTDASNPATSATPGADPNAPVDVADPNAAAQSSASPAATSDTGIGGGAGGFDMGGITDQIGGFTDMAGDIAGTVGDVAGSIGDVVNSFSGILGSLENDPDWLKVAYPDVKYRDHKPFNGSGGENIEQWGQSKDNIKDNYADNFEDVTEEPKKTYLKDLGPVEDARENWGNGGGTSSDGTLATASRHAPRGIRRAGNGPQRAPVVPEVVRERKPRNAAVAVEAEHVIEADFDPLAARTPDDFLDTPAGGDIVAQFQRRAAAGDSALSAVANGGGQYDDISSSPAFQRAITRTAGRNYSLAEQAALVREGDIGGAGNLEDLNLKGTHYEAMNSVGLW